MDEIRKKKKKEKTIPVGGRMPESFVKRLDALGVRGTVLTSIGKKFISVFEKVQFLTEAKKTISDESSGVIIYTTMISADLYHITIKKDNQILTAELNGESVANLTVNLSDLLSTNSDNNKEN
jgi:hypothetical protein